MKSTVEELVGREPELEQLEQFLDRAAAGPESLVLEGEAGIGKTTLWHAAHRSAETRGFAALASRPGEFETALPYLALRDLLWTTLGNLIESLPEVSARALERALVGPGFDSGPLDQRAVCIAFLEALQALAETSPVLVAIDDAQWLDAASARALAFAVRRLSSERLSFLVTVREPRQHSPEIKPAFPEQRHERMQVDPLDMDTTDRLLRTRLGTAFRRPTLRALHRTSGGNPLFALELARAVIRDGATISEGDQLPVPETLQDLMADRLGRLPEDIQEGLLVVAAAAQPTVGDIESALSRARASELLAAAVEAGVIEVDRGHVRFTHPLLGSVLYRQAPLERIHAAHRRLADVLTDVEERARHTALATALPNPEVAAQLDEAARRARSRGAPDAAAGFSEQALRLTSADAGEEIIRRAIAAADSYTDAGATTRAHELLAGLLPTLEAGRRRARVLHRLARLDAYEEGFRDVAGKLREALGEVGDDLHLRAAIERDLALTLSHSGQLRDAAPHARRSLDLARAAADGELEADAEATVASIEIMLGHGLPRDVEARPQPFDQVGDDDRLERHPALLLHALTWGAIRKWSDDFDRARGTLEDLLARLIEREEEGLLVPVFFHLAELECWTGNLAAAQRYAAACFECTQRAAQPGTRALALYAIALVDAHSGRMGEARSAAEEGLAQAEKADDPRMRIRHLKTLGFVELSLGDPAAAEHWLGRAIDVSAAVGYGEPGLFRFDGDAIESLVAVGKLDQASELTESLAERGARLGRPSALATVERSRALLAAARGELDRAERALEFALTEFGRLPLPLDHGRTLLLLGTVRRRMRQKRRAREDLEHSRAIFEALPAPLWAKAASQELNHISGRTATEWELTATELQVAELVAEGLTNREVALRLYVTQKTVEFHLRNIFRKVGVRSRTELARAFALKH